MYNPPCPSSSVFTTLTFPRSKNIRDTWLSINQATNRYVQRVRRTIDYCEYVKAYEIHKDGYPHVHILFIFRNFRYNSNHTRWLPDTIFAKLKSAWTLGLSDHQSPTSSSNHSGLSYILKYLSKSSSANHLWSKILTPDTSYSPTLNENGYPILMKSYAGYALIIVPSDVTLTQCNLKYHKIKLLTWSRKFTQSYLKSLQTTEPCPNSPSLHTPNPA